MPHASVSRGERHVLVVFLNGALVGNIYQSRSGALRFSYEDAWRQDESAYPLSLSMPLAAKEHRDNVVSSFLWGLLPDNDRTLEHHGRLFGVSARNPAALLAHIGADCAGAVQFAPPETADATRASSINARVVEWIDEHEVARELKTVREQGIPGTFSRTAGQFSLAGAQPKIALLEERGRWGRPSGRIPTNRILKPPSGEYRGFAENEHFCLELANGLELGVVKSRVMKFADEVAIVVERFDRSKRGRAYARIHQEDMCQALGVMPTGKYEAGGGPGIAAIISVLREASLEPEQDIERFIQATVLNWVLAATDSHAKNYALLHGAGGGVRLAPFYDILSYLPYADSALHRVKLAMKIGSKYLVSRVNRQSWEALAKANGLAITAVMDDLDSVLERLPKVVDRVASDAIDSGLDASIVEQLTDRILKRTYDCAGMISRGLGRSR